MKKENQIENGQNELKYSYLGGGGKKLLIELTNNIEQTAVYSHSF